MKEFKRLLFFILLLVIVASCATIHVVNINNGKEIKDSPMVYYLPKNVLQVKLDIIRTAYQCGPYNRFAKKLLGIDNQYTEHTTIWKISGLQIETYAVPDTANIYLIYNNCGNNASSFNFSDDGILLSVNSKPDSFNNKKQDLIQNLVPDAKQHHLFTDLSLKKIQINRSDTVYKKVRRDSGFVKVPEVNVKIVNKNLEEKAEEIATQIFTIREEKINILTGDYNASINGQAVKAIIEEFDKIEEKFIALFTTIISQDTISYTFKYSPDSKKVNSQILCYFSESAGISIKSDVGLSPVIIDVLKNNGNKSVAEVISGKMKKQERKQGLYYRIPEYADARILYKDVVIASKKLLISQFGSVMSLPQNTLKGKSTSIEFYKDFGSLKSIKQKNHHRRKFFK